MASIFQTDFAAMSIIRSHELTHRNRESARQWFIAIDTKIQYILSAVRLQRMDSDTLLMFRKRYQDLKGFDSTDTAVLQEMFNRLGFAFPQLDEYLK